MRTTRTSIVVKFVNLETYFYWTSNNDESIHPQPTGVYAWAVRDGDVTIEELLAALHNASIDVGPGRILERKAELALTYYTAGDTFATCVAMSDYVLTLIDYTEKKKPKVTPDLASALLGDAERIIVTITCD